MYIKLICLFVCVFAVNAEFEGESCTKDGINGVCTILSQCQTAINDIRNRKNPQICSFKNTDPIVCCLDGRSSQPPVVIKPLTTTKRPVRPVEATTEYIPPVYDYQDNNPLASQCEPIPASFTAAKTGQKAFDKCIEYQEKYIYPCEKGVALTGGMTRSKHCHHDADDLIIGGVNAAQYEFPHMVLVGYGDRIEDLQYLCGGSIISEKFILTAGHCISSRDLGPITYVAIGALSRDDAADLSKVYKVRNIIKHPEYRPPIKYNDIALLETEKPMVLDQFVLPACLDVGDTTNDEKVLATGWGLTAYRGSISPKLQKVTLQKFTTEECSSQWPTHRTMKQGFNPQSQTCYGDRNVSKDTCQGDSGGPIQVKNKKINYTNCEIIKTGEKGVCRNLELCPTAIRDLKFKIHPQICYFNGTSRIPIVCCLETYYKVEPLVQRLKGSSDSSEKENTTCSKNQFKYTKPSGTILGEKAWQKCAEHQSKIDLPCENGRRVTDPYCGVPDSLITGGGGIDVEDHEFPHMALLGYGKNFSEATFGCGGSLISETFVLTAGHCTATRTLEKVSYAVFGILERAEIPDAPPENIRQFKSIVKHPQYKPPSVYHDIALLELDKPIQQNYKIRPACLHVGSDIYDIRAYATGWGALGHKRPNANVLQNVPLWKPKDEVCKAMYPPHRVFAKGYDNNTQMCYGDDGIPRDTCQGDSGGPLQILNPDGFCTYLIIGVTSVGNTNCAQVGFPGLYTRVSHYVPWIESVVWP
uniref:Peptidase S1 domain-containing protein n=1 Tax=Heliothis virescens TaxID=7102 RepID=A0A2A4K236_HELVI